MTNSDITKNELALIKRLRETLAGEISAHYDDNYNLLRWLRGYNNDIDQILPKIRKHFELRQALNLDSIRDQSYELQFGEVVREYYPTGFAGFDKEGNVIVIEPIGLADPKNMMMCEKSSDFVRSRIMSCEYVLFLIRQQERKLKKKCGLFLISDMEGFTLEKIYMPAMNIYTCILTLMQDNYPDILQRIYMIRSPPAMQVAYRIILPFLSKQTRDKIHIVGGHQWTDKLLKYADSSQLPPLWGGTMQGPNGEPNGCIKMGGPVPAHLRYDSSSDPLESELIELSVPRKVKEQLAYDVSEAGYTLQWYFKMPCYDIDFGIFLVHDNDTRKTIVPKFRINSEFVPEWGSFECSENGTYLIEFDNSYSWLRAKTVLYKIDLVRTR